MIRTLPLVTWFLATFLLCEAKKGMSAVPDSSARSGLRPTKPHGISAIAFARQCMKQRPRTAWRHGRDRRNICERQEAPMASKEREESGHRHPATQWRSAADSCRDAKSATVREIINANIGGHVEVIMTDESAIYPWALEKMQRTKHRTINHSREYAHGDVHTNTVESAFSLLKRGIVGSWHKVRCEASPCLSR